LQQRNEIAAWVNNQVKEDLRREALSERDSAIASSSEFRTSPTRYPSAKKPSAPTKRA
jgi:hypothetical protein